MSRLRTNRAVFTLNNYDVCTLDKITEWFDNDKDIKYGIVGQEVGEEGTPHLQGFIHYNIDRKKAGIKFWKDLVPEGARAHFQAARGSDADSRAYCSKEGIFIETGEPLTATNQWGEIFETAKTDLEAALAINPEISIKHYHQIKAIHADHNNPKLNHLLPVLRDWQEVALRLLRGQDDRQILFVVDKQGGKGKSALAKHILTGENAWACQGKSFRLRPPAGVLSLRYGAIAPPLGFEYFIPRIVVAGGKIGDLMHSYDPKAEWVVFDMARCNNPDYYPWNFMENLKNGWFTSTKYNGGMRVFTPPKIIVFMNDDPPRNKLSDDRYQVFVI